MTFTFLCRKHLSVLKTKLHAPRKNIVAHKNNISGVHLVCDENICDYNRFKNRFFFFFLSTHFRSCFVNVCNVYISIGPQTMSFTHTHTHTSQTIHTKKNIYYIYINCTHYTLLQQQSARALFYLLPPMGARARPRERERMSESEWETDKIYEFEMFSEPFNSHTLTHTQATRREL